MVKQQTTDQTSPIEARRLEEIIRRARRVVVKIGSSVLVTEGADRLSPKALGGVASRVGKIRKKGVEIVLVTSGAIASGMKSLGFKKKPHKISDLQACAAVGQPILIRMYQQAFATARLQVAQLLLTRGDLADRTRYLNAKHTLNSLLSRNILPIINENDTVAVEEIRFGDNDNLASLVTNLVDADLLILLTDQDAFYTADPRKDRTAARIPVVKNVDEDLFARASDAGSALSVGGMKTKLEAAQKAAEFGIPTIIASGKDPKILDRIFSAESVGTLFLPRVARLTARKHWIAHTLKPSGWLLVDDGAKQALTQGKKSLLSSGIVQVRGGFRAGDPVDIVGVSDPSGESFARGLIAYDSKEMTLIAGKKSSQIEGILGYRGPDEVVHRNDLVML